MRAIAAICPFALLVLGTPSAEAAEARLWKQVRGWDVRIDETLQNSCFATTSFDGGTLLRIGFDRQQDDAYIIVGDTDWASLESGELYPITMIFDKSRPWNGKATGIKVGDGSLVFLQLRFSDTNFIREFMAKHAVNVLYNDESIAKLSLAGSSAAFAEVIRCHQAAK